MWLSGLISAVVVAAATGIYFFIRRPLVVRELLGSQESFEITYEFLLVTVVGGLLALLYKQLDVRREQRRDLREMYSEILGAYNRAKSVRRRMRARLGTAKAINKETPIAADYYEEQIEVLSNAQLTFEVYVKRTKGPLWFWRARHLAENLEEAQSYLNGIVKEYEEKLATFSAEDPRTAHIGQLEKLTEFIGPYHDARDFKGRLKLPVRDALAALGKVILR